MLCINIINIKRTIHETPLKGRYLTKYVYQLFKERYNGDFTKCDMNQTHAINNNQKERKGKI